MSATDTSSTLPARTRKRVTGRLIPYLMFIYLLAYLDRANVGVAKLGMQKDLNFSDAVIGFGAGIFFLGYLLLDIPGSLIVERWSARMDRAHYGFLGSGRNADGFSGNATSRFLPPWHAILRLTAIARHCGGGLFPWRHRISFSLVQA